MCQYLSFLNNCQANFCMLRNSSQWLVGDIISCNIMFGIRKSSLSCIIIYYPIFYQIVPGNFVHFPMFFFCLSETSWGTLHRKLHQKKLDIWGNWGLPCFVIFIYIFWIQHMWNIIFKIYVFELCFCTFIN